MPTLAERYEAQKVERTVQETKEAFPIPQALKERVDRGRSRMKDDDSERQEIMQFFRNNQYVYRSPKGYLLQQDRVTLPGGGGKPPHRIRMVRNILFDLIQHQISNATSRIPSFEVSPATSDPQDEDAAALAEKVALYGYDKWDLRSVGLRMVTLCTLLGEGFAWPYFDNTVGPYFKDADGELVGQGEVRVRVFTGSQVAWEPGIRFQDSPWCSVDVALPPEEVKALEDFVGGPLVPDADVGGIGKASNAKLVLCTHYLERPCKTYPNGRWYVFANDRIIVDRKDYPCADGDGKVIDEPVLHYLSYVEDPDNDRNFGLGRLLVDLQRTYNDVWNKLTEWKNLAAVGQLFVTPGLLKRQRITDAPGEVYEIPQPEQNVKERTIGAPPMALFDMIDRTKDDMGRIAAQNDIPSQVESGKAIQPLLERDKGRQGSFYENLAEWWSKLQRHNLYLVQRHYSEHDNRILKLQGEWGPDRIDGFKGADLRGQADIRVYAGSIEPRSRQAIESKVLAFADRGWITPQAAMAAINGGNAETLVDDYLKDVAWARRLIDKIVAGPAVLFSEPMRLEMQERPVIGPDGQPVVGPDGMPVIAPQQTEVPAWLPRKFHNVPVITSIMESWLKSRQYERLDPPMREAADQVYEALQDLTAQKAQRDAEQQAMVAESQGMENAAKEQGVKPMPDKAGGGGGLPTPNQPPEQSQPS